MTGQELQQWRKSVGLTQTGLAQRMGVSLRTVQNMESGDLLTVQEHHSVNAASQMLVLEVRDGGVLTPSAFSAHIAVDQYVTDEVRAKFDTSAAPRLTDYERRQIAAVEEAVLFREMTDEERDNWLVRIRAIGAD